MLQGILTQELDFTTTPLDYALLERSLGPARTMAWFPVLAAAWPVASTRPLRYRGLAPTAARSNARSSAPAASPKNSQPPRHRGAWPARRWLRPRRGPGHRYRGRSVLHKQRCRRPIHRYPDSNAWAANGARVAGRLDAGR